MKNYIILSLCIATLLVSCMPTEEVTPLSELKEKRDNVIASRDSLNQIIKDFETQIAELDTTKKAPLVAVEQLAEQPFEHYFKVQGNVEAEKSATLFPETQGLIKSIRVEEGQRVSAGQTLMVLDNDIIAKNIQEVETSLALAADVFERQERLWNQNIGSEMQYLEAKNRKESLENTIATLRKQQSMGTVRAPFSGVIDKIYPKVGEMGSPMSPAINLVNLGKLNAKADVSEKYLSLVKKGAMVKVTFGDGLDTLKGKVSRIGSSINPANRTFEITVDFLEKSDYLRPNLMAEIEINDFSAEKAVVVGSSTIQQDTDGNNFVYVLTSSGKDTLAAKKVVEVGKSYGDETMILAGLDGSEKIITAGARKIIAGQKVRLN